MIYFQNKSYTVYCTLEPQAPGTGPIHMATTNKNKARPSVPGTLKDITKKIKNIYDILLYDEKMIDNIGARAVDTVPGR